MGSHRIPNLTDTSDAGVPAEYGFVVGGWGRQMSGCVVGDYSQREVLPLGPLSLSTNTRGTPSFFSSTLRTLEGKGRKVTFSRPLLVPGTVLSTFTNLISFNSHCNLGRCYCYPLQ